MLYLLQYPIAHLDPDGDYDPESGIFSVTRLSDELTAFMNLYAIQDKVFQISLDPYEGRIIFYTLDGTYPYNISLGQKFSFSPIILTKENDISTIYGSSD